MIPLEHAEAHERLADLALEPDGLVGLEDGGGLDEGGARAGGLDDPLRAHVRTCEACRTEIDAWRRTQAALDAAREPMPGEGPGGRTSIADLVAGERFAAPASIRATLRASIGATGERPAAPDPVPATRPAGLEAPEVPRVPARSNSRRALPWLGLAAALVLVVAGAGVLVQRNADLDAARREASALEAVAATVDRILREPEHWVVELRTADGTANGTLSWSNHDLVVLTTALAAPPPDEVYRCWVERDGRRAPVGRMVFAGGTAFWVGSVDDWATVTLDPGGTFGISLEPAAAPEGNPPVLAATLGG